MNKINVIDKTEKIKLGKYYELRGNFVEQTDEEGNVSYTCDMFRTTNSADTFESLYEEYERSEKIAYLEATNYISCNYADCLTDEEKASFLAEVSDTHGITNGEIITKRKEYKATL